MRLRHAAFLVCFAAATAQTKLPDIAGEWDGILAGKLHVIVKLQVEAGGALKGSLQSPDQGPGTIAIDAVKLDPPGTVRLELNSLKAAFEGQLTADASEIHGKWQQGGQAVPLILHRPGADLKLSLHATMRGRVPLKPCMAPDNNTEGLCGTYEVFENRDTRAGRKISLRILLLPAVAAKPDPDPVFTLAGGPGQSTVEAAPPAGYIAKLREHRDIVLVDQRGTGQSAPLPCTLADPLDAQALIGTVFPVDAAKACRTALEARADLTQYTTSIFTDDLDEVRDALGYGKIDLLGGSYGSRAALVYLRRHPANVRLMVLSQVVSPGYKLGLNFAKPIQASVERLFADCAAEAKCREAFPNLRAEYRTILERLDKTPATFDFYDLRGKKHAGITLSRGMFVANLRPILYSPDLAAALPYIIHQAFQNDWSGYGRAAFAVISGITQALDRGMGLSVICAEDVPFFSAADVRRETEGTDLGSFLVPVYQSICAQWPRAKVPDDFSAPVKSEVPALLISGAQDPATPASTAQEVARTLPNSKLVVIDQGTHLTASPCLDGLIAQFVADGSGARLNTACVQEIKRPPFLTPAAH